MSAESTTLDLIERWRESADAFVRGDFDAGMGFGVVFAVLGMEGSPAGSPGRMQDRYALTVVWAAELIVRVIVREEIEEARATAEALAESRG